jgi:hypothetical protein
MDPTIDAGLGHAGFGDGRMGSMISARSLGLYIILLFGILISYGTILYTNDQTHIVESDS